MTDSVKFSLYLIYLYSICETIYEFFTQNKFLVPIKFTLKKSYYKINILQNVGFKICIPNIIKYIY